MMPWSSRCVVLEGPFDQARGTTMADRTYEVRVTGLVPTQDLLDELGDVEIAEHEVRTVLSARFPDQAALYGFLNRLRAFGLEVVEVRRVPAAGHAAPGDGEAS
jgi:hypothetical protein